MKKTVILSLTIMLVLLVSRSNAIERHSLLPNTNSVNLIQGKNLFPSMYSIMSEFMKQFNIVGASVAIVKNEKLVYINNYGYQDSYVCGLILEPVE